MMERVKKIKKVLPKVEFFSNLKTPIPFE